jgi:GNAT superfamily N-acetyltransferase
MLRRARLLVHVLPGERQGRLHAAQRHAALVQQGSPKSLIAQDPPPGLLGYLGKTPVGWVSLGPREHYAKLARSPVKKPVDDQVVWSVVCFVVPSGYRKQGVARELLAGAVHYAMKRGVRLLEAYPVDKDEPSATEAPWFGSKSMFDEAGFRLLRQPAVQNTSIVRSDGGVQHLL